MPDTYKYVKIDKENIGSYKEYLPDVDQGDEKAVIDPKDFGIGIYKNKTPCGAVVLHKYRERIAVRSIRFDDSSGKEPEVEILRSIQKFAGIYNFKSIECRFTDDEPKLTEDILRKAGFTEFDEEAVVFRIDAFSLGSLLRDGPYAVPMYNMAMKVLNQKRARCFSKVSHEVYEPVRELYPDSNLSFMTVDRHGKLESYVVISRLPDGSIYLGDLFCPEGRERDLEALMFMSFGKVFMEIVPSGDFYIAAVNEAFRNMADVFFAPLGDSIGRQKIFVAKTRIDA